jgi:hypothetical protein
MRVFSLSTALLIGAAYATPVTTEDDACAPTVTRDINEAEATFQELFASASAVASAALASSTGSCTAENIVVRKEWYVLPLSDQFRVLILLQEYSQL